MKETKVLGSGCAKCTKAMELIQSVASELGTSVNVIKETSPEVIMSFGVMTTPAIAVDRVLVHSGSVPSKEQIEDWLK
jgi:small redox-active disulfide protein 2